MMKIKITSDSTCDLSQQLLEQHDIMLTPLYINKGDECLRDVYDVTPDDIYAHVAGGGELCTTAAKNISDYLELFQSLRQEYDAVIHINISADFSSCHQNAVLAAQELENVYVVDSRNLSTGHGHVVLRAAELAEQGMAPEMIVEELKALTEKVDASFILSQLEYLRKGGRCSGVVALGANLLKLKPCIEVVDGKMSVGKKYRGAFEKCIEQYVRDRLTDMDSIDTRRIFITHSGVEESSIEIARKAVADCGAFEEVIVTRAGCTISCHCGPGTLGVLFVRK